MVLNSLSGELFQAAINCMARGGRFLELGKVDFLNRTSIDSNVFLKNCSFHGILLDYIFHSPLQDKIQLHKLLSEGE